MRNKMIVVAALGMVSAACAKDRVIPATVIGDDGGVEENCDGRPVGSRQTVLEPGFCTDSVQICRASGWYTERQGRRALPERCNGVDDDCNGAVDEGCMPTCVPSPETCEVDPVEGARDEDCDGLVNEGCNAECEDGETEGCLPPGVPPGVVGRDDVRCTLGVLVCEDGHFDDVCQLAVLPEPESCNGRDDDCDGLVDEDFPDLGDACDGIGACGGGLWECRHDQRDKVCSTDRGGSEFNPGTEICDGEDNDCDGNTDEGFFIGAPCRWFGVCDSRPDGSEGVRECLGPFETRCSLAPGGSESPAEASESCDTFEDDDCDGDPNEGCDCLDGAVEPCGDGNVGECRDGTQTCIGGVWGPCVDAIRRAPSEICDGRDNDCDGEIDEDFEIGEACDGTGECGDGVWQCRGLFERFCSSDPGGRDFSLGGTVGAETCDNLDNDCNGVVDEGFFVDAPCTPLGACAGFSGRLECRPDGAGTQCDTGENGSDYRGGPEVCDAARVDEDCDGSPNAGCNCGNDEPPRSCGSSDVGACRRGVQRCVGGRLTACDAIEPSPELCNGLDDDCDGTTDEDFRVGIACDGIGGCGPGFNECATPTTWRCDTDVGGSHDQSIGETCNDIDDDCDGETDEPFFIGAPCEGIGVCGPGVYECTGPFSIDCNTNRGGSFDQSRPEQCLPDLVDEDCDEQVNEVCACADGQRQPCGPPNVGECRRGEQLCAGGRWGDCEGDIEPDREVCDNRDNDCDGISDEGFDLDNDPENCGACGRICNFPNVVVHRCVARNCVISSCQHGWVDVDGNPVNGCEYECLPTRGGVEVCDAIDNDCDRQVDEGLACGGGPGCMPVPEVCNGADDDCDGAVDEGGVCMCPAEICNGADDDCDGLVDEGSNLCNLRNVDVAACSGGGCVIVRCTPNFWDCNGVDADGCEYNCIPSGPEICGNGADDDCDCSVDNDPPRC